MVREEEWIKENLLSLRECALTYDRDMDLPIFLSLKPPVKEITGIGSSGLIPISNPVSGRTISFMIRTGFSFLPVS